MKIRIKNAKMRKMNKKLRLKKTRKLNEAAPKKISFKKRLIYLKLDTKSFRFLILYLLIKF